MRMGTRSDRVSCLALRSGSESDALVGPRDFYVSRGRGVAYSSRFWRTLNITGVLAGKAGLKSFPMFRRVPDAAYLFRARIWWQDLTGLLKTLAPKVIRGK